MAAAEERERRIAVLQQEVDSLKARLWDSAARIGDLEKCADRRPTYLSAVKVASPYMQDKVCTLNRI